MDTYDLFFTRFRLKGSKYDMELMDKVLGIYNDQLQAVFTDKTGLNTYL